MNKIIGDYGIIESAISVVVFGFLCYLNYLFFMGLIEGGKLTERISFMMIFFDLIGLVLVALPYITKKAEMVSNETLKTFLDLPSEDTKFTFSAISGFLSDQALASFLVTVLSFTGKQALEIYGGVITAFYVVSLYIVALILGAVSLIRFINHFTKYHSLFYALVSVISVGIMFAFLNVGLKMAP